MIVLFTGGGTAGHILPNVPVIERLLAQGAAVHYAGSGAAMERDLLGALPITYHTLATGKLRRYLSWQNLRDVFRVLQGIAQGVALVRRLRPDVVFSKGGFVSVPAVLGAALCRVPIVAHESDRSPGLANRIAHRVAQRICTSFPETRFASGAAERVVYTGLPVREALYQGDAVRGRAWLEVPSDARAVLLVMGGSQGSAFLNRLVRELLPRLREASIAVAHLCGRGGIDTTLAKAWGYRQYEFVTTELGDLLACADVVLSRAGATTLYELFAVRKAVVLVPLTLSQSRGDQIENAQWAAARGLAIVEPEEQLDAERCFAAIENALANASDFVAKQASAFPRQDSVARLVEVITAAAERR